MDPKTLSRNCATAQANLDSRRKAMESCKTGS